MYGDAARFFEDELRPGLKHLRRGTVGMASAGPDLNASQFYITTGEALDSLDGRHTVFGEVSEGLEVLDKINEAFVDDEGRPLQNIRCAVYVCGVGWFGVGWGRVGGGGRRGRRVRVWGRWVGIAGGDCGWMGD